MALKFISACILVATLAPLAEACDPTRLQGQLATCQTQLGGSAGGDICSVLEAYTLCVDDATKSCPPSVKNTFTSVIDSVKAPYSSKLADCSSSSSPSGSGEKESSTGSSNDNEKEHASDSCTSLQMSSKSSSCIQAMTAAAAGGNVCNAWQTYECCLKDAFSSCGSDMEGKISTMISTMKTQYKNMLPGLAQCAEGTCSSGSSSTPADVETTHMASIELADPLAFDVNKYVEAVKKATGVSQLPKAVVKAFEIFVKYVLSDATTMADMKAAVAKANDVAESQVHVTQSQTRRLGSGRHLATNMLVDVTITVPDATKAASVKTSAAQVATLESALGGTVSVAKAPVAVAKVETKVQSAPSSTSQLASKIESAGPDIGGTITVAEQIPEFSSGASSNFSNILAALAIVFWAAL